MNNSLPLARPAGEFRAKSLIAVLSSRFFSAEPKKQSWSSVENRLATNQGHNLCYKTFVSSETSVASCLRSLLGRILEGRGCFLVEPQILVERGQQRAHADVVLALRRACR